MPPAHVAQLPAQLPQLPLDWQRNSGHRRSENVRKWSVRFLLHYADKAVKRGPDLEITKDKAGILFRPLYPRRCR
ncbi:hypothetical protein GO730_02145 [Spirosoma sp. HMF3257]|uniref:hypothetical protein n=1 Tax=Spirosoma telluris TaxID=2183553 RepID=UPI0011B94234|nr:hypothetical protein [Spirosoma telluris]